MDTYICHDVKVYQINLDFYELIKLKETSSGVISHIIEYHKEHFKSEYSLDYSTRRFTIEPYQYTLYSFNEREKESMWKDFLPEELIGDRDFTIKSTSFALFIQANNRIFSIIGGKGISVIKRFINHTFGLDFYEKLAEPENDIVYSHVSRGVAGNLTSEQRTFRNEQKLQDTLSIGRVPKKYYILLRTDLKDTVFDFIDFGDSENIYIEIGAAFFLKWKIDFSQLQSLIIKINEVLDFDNGRSLSRFEKVQDEQFVNGNLLPALLTHLRDDVVRLTTPGSNLNMLLDYDFVHPSKLNTFYECDEYLAFTKGSQTPFFTTRDRLTLYSSILEYVYSQVDPSSSFEFNKMILGVRIRGYIGQQKKTEAMFINHLTCELSSTARPYFLIDNQWYSVKGDFIKTINDQCLQIIRRNLLLPNPLDLPWEINESEGEYNSKYLRRVNYFVFDKMLGQNIELCDVIYETEQQLFLIHVKDGFDAKIRDLTNQASISANRLWNDLRAEKKFLNEVFSSYDNSANNHSGLTRSSFIEKFNKEIIYVLAFTSSIKRKTVLDNFEDHRSNIAKFSIIQNFSEVQTTSYQMRVIEVQRNYI